MWLSLVVTALFYSWTLNFERCGSVRAQAEGRSDDNGRAVELSDRAVDADNAQSPITLAIIMVACVQGSGIGMGKVRLRVILPPRFG